MSAPAGQAPPCIARLRDGCWRLTVWVQPGAGRSEPAGLYQGCAKIRLAAPPVDGKANKALVDFVARRLGLRAAQVELAAGQTSRRKTLHIRAQTEPAWEQVVSAGDPTDFQP